jgi:hypothetical protein
MVKIRNYLNLLVGDDGEAMKKNEIKKQKKQKKTQQINAIKTQKVSPIPPPRTYKRNTIACIY